MNSKIKDILDTIESNGYEAYVVGGYVRDHLLGIESSDVDICTNALPKELNNIFKGSLNSSCYGAFKITTSSYNFDITTYRKELSYTGRRPTTIEYVNSLLVDVSRRDFTINTICMGSNGDIIDLVGGVSDLNKRLIKCVGDTDDKFTEDPLRMLRAVRFAITLDFKLDKSIVKSIKKNKGLIKELSYTRKKDEIDKILTSKYVVKGINLLKDLGLYKELEINIKKLVSVSDINGMYAQIDFSDNYSFSKSEINNILGIKRVLKYGKIDNKILYEEGLYICSVAGSIKGIDRTKITSMYDSLPIHSTKDIDINANKILEVLNISDNRLLKNIYNHLVDCILSGKIKNEYQHISKYLIDHRRLFING